MGTAASASQDAGPWKPARVIKALEKSRKFDEYRKNRPFRYLHMFSGEQDQLASSLKRAAKNARLEVYVESLDRKRDKEIDLAAPSTYDEIGKSVEEGEWDGFHSGFPCGSFSRVRWRDTGAGPGPERECSAHLWPPWQRYETAARCSKKPTKEHSWQRGRRGFTENKWKISGSGRCRRCPRWKNQEPQTRVPPGICPKSNRCSTRQIRPSQVFTSRN